MATFGTRLCALSRDRVVLTAMFLRLCSFPYGNGQTSNTVELIHDAFMNVSYWADFMPKPAYQGVAIDTHIYQVFSDAENARSQQQHIDNACQNGPKLADFNNNQLWTIVGEWTPAMTDCAKYLNGRGVGARYDGSFTGSTAVGSCSDRTGSISDLASSYKTFLRKMFEAQVSSCRCNSSYRPKLMDAFRPVHSSRAVDGLCGPGRQRM